MRPTETRELGVGTGGLGEPLARKNPLSRMPYLNQSVNCRHISLSPKRQI